MRADRDHSRARVPHRGEPIGGRQPQLAEERLAHRPPAQDRAVVEEEADVVTRLALQAEEALRPPEP